MYYLQKGMALAGLYLPRGIVYNTVWLVCALSFLWFPYIGMVILPCRKNPEQVSSHHSVSWSPYKQTTVATDYTHSVPISNFNATATDVMEDQRRRMESFCAIQNMPTTVYDEPTVRDLYHHILVDDERKILFCYIPKVGCSNWKRVFLILAGMVNPIDHLRPNIEVFRQVNSLENYSPKEQEHRLRSYFKFMFVRHPPERVLSAYRNKIEGPVHTNPSDKSIWDEVKHFILESYRLKFNNKMLKNGAKVYPTFSEFIHFLYDSDAALMNEHYKPMVELCQPCAVKYNFVGNFATLRQDANTILEYLHINSTLFWDRGKHRTNETVSYIKGYYEKLHPIDFRRLEEKFADDLAFYNHLFPFEQDGGYATLTQNSL